MMKKQDVPKMKFGIKNRTSALRKMPKMIALKVRRKLTVSVSKTTKTVQTVRRKSMVNVLTKKMPKTKNVNLVRKRSMVSV